MAEDIFPPRLASHPRRASEEGDQSIPANLVVAPALMLTLMPICVGLRLWSQRLRRESLDASCCCIIVAFAVSVVVIGLSIYLVTLGITQVQASDVDGKLFYADEANVLKPLYASSILSFVSIAASRLAVLLCYRRVFPTSLVRYATAAIGLFITIWAIVSIFIDAFLCHPVDAFWNAQQMMEDGQQFSCISNQEFFQYSIVPNIVADFAMLALPIHEVSKLHMDRKTKVGVSTIFLLGGVVTAIAVVRFTLSVTMGSHFSAAVPWTIAEQGLSVICACLLSMGAAIRHIKTALFGRRNPSVPEHSRRVSFAKSVTSNHTFDHTSRRTKSIDGAREISNPKSKRKTPPKSTRSSPSFFSSPVAAFRDAIGWGPLPVVQLPSHSLPRSHHLHTHSASSETDRSAFNRDFRMPAAHNRNSTEMEEYRRLYQYSGQNPFSQDAYANMTDSELYGGIRVEQTVDLRVEEVEDYGGDTSGAGMEQAEPKVFDGRSGGQAVTGKEVV